MNKPVASPELLGLLNHAIARELQVSIQYMLQHAIEACRVSASAGPAPADRQTRFVASHAMLFAGVTLKKIAITEMRHAEAIVERVVVLGGKPATDPLPHTIADTPKAMLAHNAELERSAIELYTRIIGLAGEQKDSVTLKLFRQILSDEEKHLRTFSELLGGP